MAMKTLLIIPSVAKCGLEAEIAADRHPTMDYDALAAALRSTPGDRVDVLDHAAVDRDSDLAVQCVRKLAGRNAALAVMAFQRRSDYDVIFTNAENVALPLSLLLKTVAKRPRHVTIAHRLSARKKRPFYRWLQVHHEMDVIFLYASAQRDFAREVLGIPGEKIHLIPFHADHRFYRPLPAVPVRESQISAAGLEWRDYPTLIDAVADQTDLCVKLAAASPWSRHDNETESCAVPSHVDVRSYDYRELRDLYAGSSFVVVPLYENDFQAGITTILEAMAMGKAVVVTGTSGQSDVIVEGQNGLYVAPGDVQGWRHAIERLRQDAPLRARLGQGARRWVEDHATLDQWVANVAAAVRGRPVRVAADAPSRPLQVAARLRNVGAVVN
jgi:glycosyltransferase involved in cell wall biosynthesis